MSAWLWSISPVPSRPSSFSIPNKTPLLVLTLATGPGISPCRGVKENSHVSEFLDRKDTEQSWNLGHPHPSVPLQGAHFCLGPGCSTCDRGHSLFGDKTVKLSANYVLPSVNMSQAVSQSTNPWQTGLFGLDSKQHSTLLDFFSLSDALRPCRPLPPPQAFLKITIHSASQVTVCKQ